MSLNAVDFLLTGTGLLAMLQNTMFQKSIP